MKRLIAAAILVAFVIFSYFFSMSYILKCCETTDKMVDEAIISYKNNEAQQKAIELKKYWQRKEIILSLFLNHNQIDDVEESISGLNVYAKEENNMLFYEYAEKIKIFLHQIQEDTKFTTHSIL